MSDTQSTGDNVTLTLLLVHTEHDDNLIPPNANELLNRPDSSPRKLREQDHSFNVVILEL
jgi:hypothetical protein